MPQVKTIIGVIYNLAGIAALVLIVVFLPHWAESTTASGGHLQTGLFNYFQGSERFKTRGLVEYSSNKMNFALVCGQNCLEFAKGSIVVTMLSVTALTFLSISVGVLSYSLFVRMHRYTYATLVVLGTLATAAMLLCYYFMMFKNLPAAYSNRFGASFYVGIALSVYTLMGLVFV